jgi:hypothetical protein
MSSELAALLAFPIEASLRAEPHLGVVAIDICVWREAMTPRAGRLLLSIAVGLAAMPIEDRLAIAARIVKSINHGISAPGGDLS